MHSLRRLFVLYLVIFIGFAGYSLLITIFTPLILAGSHPLVPANLSLSGRTILLGALVFLYPFGQFIASPILGGLSDRFGRKRILIPSLCLTIVGYAAVALSVSHASLPFLLISLLITGLAEGNVVIAQSAIADVVPKEQRARYFGYVYMCASLAFGIGTLAGGKTAAYYGYAMPFWGASGLLALIMFCSCLFFRETHAPDKREHVHYFEALTNLKHVFTSRLRRLFLINFLIYLSVFGFVRCYPMFLIDTFNMGVSDLSHYIAWVSVPIILVNLGVLSYFTKRLNPLQLTLFGAIFTAVATEMIVLFAFRQALLIILFLAGAAIAIALPACASMLSHAASEKEQGRVMGNNQSLQFFAEAISGLVGGLIAALMIKLSLIILGLLAFFAGIMLIFRKKSALEAPDF